MSCGCKIRKANDFEAVGNEGALGGRRANAGAPRGGRSVTVAISDGLSKAPVDHAAPH